jgi:site-specific DNA-methyltransferase (adenine-specific)
VFSPPYANRFDYFESQKVELWFGGFVSSYEDLNRLRKESLRSHLGADLSRPARTIPVLEELISMMDRSASSWRMGVPSALRGYFDDMHRTLRACRRLVPNGRCNVVVGNSAFAGVIIPTDALIAQLGLEAGFTTARLLVVRHLTVAPQQRSKLEGLESFMRESVVVLE